ncbi:Hachiman antiphage defense system protein HamA [Nocardia beijingensis]|uniref:Hachiman antiphage defense system protein HamA n=1 Tax=Nocardia beijingensis TaxID=95162 RepID=A0ABW7W886_9NOCA
MEEPVPVGGHHASVVESRDDATGIAILAAVLPGMYAKTETLARLAEHLGKDAVAGHLRAKLPTSANARSGDMGEILAAAYLQEEQGYVVGPSRLVDRDHQEWAMRGDDVLAAKLTDGKAQIVKAEAKSALRIGKATVTDAREGLSRNDEMPAPQSLAQFVARLLNAGIDDIGIAVADLQRGIGLRPDQIRHLMFLFTGSDPSRHITADLEAYSGSVPQLAITLRPRDHRTFIKSVYETVIASGP